MSGFNDEDLRRLKVHVAKHRNLVIPLSSDGPSIYIESILSRLEAAEKLSKDTEIEHMRYVEFVYSDVSKHVRNECRICAAHQAWLRSKEGADD